ncbi:hypothetical protein B5S29_g5916 [[Candida] boidinii]|nr:hypothetical protein B5S29_g5916 [[Candida] boidinii]
MYGPAIAAIPGPAAPTPNIPLPQSSSELPEDSSFAPSPSVSIDEGSPSVASSLDSDNFADMSDDDVASDSVPILSIPDAPAVSTPSTTVFDRSVIPSEHGLLPVVPQKRDVDEDDSSFPSPKRHAQFPLPASCCGVIIQSKPLYSAHTYAGVTVHSAHMLSSGSRS